MRIDCESFVRLIQELEMDVGTSSSVSTVEIETGAECSGSSINLVFGTLMVQWLVSIHFLILSMSC